MAYNPAATDNLTVVNISPKAGSAITFNFDAAGANNAALGFDNSANGKGTADTIVVAGAATPTSKSTINFVNSGGAPASLTGSVALIYTGVNLSAPAAGASIVSSSYYGFGTGNQSTGKTIFYLVDDGKGGVYLQWAPNLSTSALGGFGGALGAGGANGASPSGAAVGAAIAGAAGGSAGLGGVGLGGGPAGGGVAGAIGDMAAGSALDTGSSLGIGSTGGAARGRTDTCQDSRNSRAWGQFEGERTNFNGGARGQSESLAGGIEFEGSDRSQLGCNRIALGFFGFGGTARTGSSNSDNNGMGGYIRASNSSGLYASLMGATSWSVTNMSNAVYASKAEKDAHSVNGVGSLGYLVKFAPATAVDFRGFASYSRNKSDPFTDSVGITVSETKDGIVTYGGSIGLHQILTPSLQGFVRAGVKWSALDSSVTAFGVTQKGAVDGMATSVEAGLTGRIGTNVQIGASGFGTFSDGATGYGGRAHVGVKF
jgi:hypothetical protein